MRESYKRNGVIYERIYEIVTYEDSENLNTEVILKFIFNKFPNVEYAYALHDKDKTESNEAKKAHTHILLRFEREKSINALAKELGINSENIQWKENWKGSVQYLIHKNDQSKYQYDKSIIHSNVNIDELMMPDIDRKKAHEEAEMCELVEIINFITNTSNPTLYEIFCFALDNSIWSTYRRNYSIIKDLLNESKGKNYYFIQSI